MLIGSPGRPRVPIALTVALFALAVLVTTATPARAQSWPRATAPHVVQVTKDVGLEDPGGLPDAQWIHLHRGHHTAPDAAQATLRVRLYTNNSAYEETPIVGSGLTQIRFLVHGVDVSGWLALDRNDFTWLLHIDNAGLDGLLDGIHDISVEVNGAARDSYMPAPIFVHITRGRSVSPDVPIMAGIGRLDDRRRGSARAVRARRGSPVPRVSARAGGRAVPRAAVRRRTCSAS